MTTLISIYIYIIEKIYSEYIHYHFNSEFKLKRFDTYQWIMFYGAKQAKTQ